MATSNPGERTLFNEPSSVMREPARNLDLSWRGLYWMGGISIFLDIVLGIVVPGFLFLPMNYERGSDGETVLKLVADHRIGWIVLQTLMLGVISFLGIIMFPAIFVSLKHLKKSVALVGASLGIVYHVLALAYYPVTLGIAYLSDLYTTSGPDRQASLAAAAEGLIAVIDAFNPLYESVLAASVLLLSIVMLRGVYHRYLAFLGIATFVVELGIVSLFPVIGPPIGSGGCRSSSGTSGLAGDWCALEPPGSER